MSKHTPDSLKGAKSPFLDSLTIPVVVKFTTEDSINPSKIKVEDNMVVKTGPVNKINKSYVVEKDRKIELYLENDKVDLRPFYAALSKEGRMLLDYIMLYCLRENKLYCYIDTKEFMTVYNVASRTTVWNCKTNLINNSFISPTSCKGWFWVNPKFIFRGYRTKIDELKDNLKFNKEE